MNITPCLTTFLVGLFFEKAKEGPDQTEEKKNYLMVLEDVENFVDEVTEVIIIYADRG